VTRFRAGLVVGKFCPLHRGHELLIRRALAESERVFVLSWAKPEFPGCGPERRARWLERLFPETERLVLAEADLAALDPPPELSVLPDDDVDIAVHRRFTAWVAERVFCVRPDAVFTSESYGEPWAADLTRHFRRGAPDHLGVTAVTVDPERASVPISGTVLRQDVHRHRAFLSPEVYRDFVKRLVLFGGESTGKSVLAAALADALGSAHVAEYGRELWEAKRGRLVFEDLLAIAEEQVAREDAAAGSANEWLICDTSPLTTLYYSRFLFGRADPRLGAHAERRYERTVLCAPDFPFVQDGTRQDESFRLRQDAWYREELARRGVPFLEVSGPHERRIADVVRSLGTFLVDCSPR
jgi:HTH-type transcriptional regulator, transcriptional repressor of NAD biosynthesis genes